MKKVPLLRECFRSILFGMTNSELTTLRHHIQIEYARIKLLGLREGRRSKEYRFRNDRVRKLRALVEAPLFALLEEKEQYSRIRECWPELFQGNV